MADFPAVSPLLDGFTVGECISSHNGVSCYALRHDASGQEFILKHISVPSSEANIQALLLSGAYTSAEDANGYFKSVADSYAAEFTLNRSFADCPFILHYLAHQVVPKESGVGFDVYAVMDRALSLKDYCADNAMTKLRAVNLGIDLCAALSVIRSAGYLHQNIKAENIFVENGKFMLGDIGLTSLQDMKYSSLPEEYISPNTAPELQDIMAGQNPTTDLYAVGMLLYRIYNADHAPFEDEKTTAKEADHMRMNGKELPVPMYADYELSEILLKACAFKPEDRYQAPDEMKQALEFYMQRNAITDTLIVPPIFADPEPELLAEEEAEETAPVRFADVAELDDDFIKHFAPDTASLEATIEDMKREDEKEALAQSKDTPDEDSEPLTEASDAVSVEEEASPEEIEDEIPMNGKLPEVTEEKPSDKEEQLPQLKGLEGMEQTPASDPNAEADSNASDEIPPSHRHRSKSSKPRKHTKLLAVLAPILMLLVAASIIYFFTPIGRKLYHYTIRVEQFEVANATPTSLGIKVVTNVDEPPIEIICNDAYGNSFRSEVKNGKAEFTDLQSGTQYTLAAALKENAGLHRLAGIDSIVGTTLPATEVLVMNASAGKEEGSVVIDLVLKDEDHIPASWTISYCCEGGDSMERTFPDSTTSFELTGLEIEKEYTFTLVSSELYCIIGETSTVFTPPKEVTVENFILSSFADGILTVSWDCTSDAPEVWEVTCTDPDGKETTVEAKECTASFENLQIGTAYTVRLNARGLFTPLSVQVPENLLHVDSFEVQEANDGLHAYWTAKDIAEGETWTLYTIACNDKSTAIAYPAEKNSMILTDLLPNTAYTLYLKLEGDRESAGHNQVTYTMPKAENFDSRGIKENNTTLSTHAVPENDWKAKDLTTAKTEFDATDKIAYKLTSRTGRYQGSFSLLYIIRDENNVPVDYGTAQLVWNEAWAWDNGADFSMGGVVDAPAKNGTFTLELYFSYDLEGYIRYKYVGSSAPFTVTGAAEE